jgi:hypothetical protein
MDCLHAAFAASHRQADDVLEVSAQVQFEGVNAFEARVLRSADL